MANYQFVLKQTWVGQEIRNILNYVVDSAGESNLQGLVDEVRAAFASQVGRFTNVWTLYGVDVYDLDIPRPRAGQPFSFTSGALVGGTSGDTLQTQAAMLVRFTGTNAVRPNRGRVFLGGMHRGSLGGSDAQWGAAAASDLTLVGSSLRQLRPASGGEADLAIMRLGANGVPTVINPVATAVAVRRPSSQRNRGLGTGS